MTNLQKLFTQIQYILVKNWFDKNRIISTRKFDSFDEVSLIYGGAPNFVSNTEILI